MRLKPLDEEDHGPEMLAMAFVFIIGFAFGGLIGFLVRGWML